MKVSINGKGVSYSPDFHENRVAWRSQAEGSVCFKLNEKIGGENCFVKRFDKELASEDLEFIRKVKGQSLENLPFVHDVVEVEEENSTVHYVITQMLDGDIWQNQLLSGMVLTPENLIIDLMTSLKQIHNQGYWHTDVCEKNIFYQTEQNRFQLIDLDSVVPLSVTPTQSRNQIGYVPSRKLVTPAIIYMNQFLGKRYKFHELPGDIFNLLEIIMLAAKVGYYKDAREKDEQFRWNRNASTQHIDLSTFLNEKAEAYAKAVFTVAEQKELETLHILNLAKFFIPLNEEIWICTRPEVEPPTLSTQARRKKVKLNVKGKKAPASGTKKTLPPTKPATKGSKTKTSGSTQKPSKQKVTAENKAKKPPQKTPKKKGHPQIVSFSVNDSTKDFAVIRRGEQIKLSWESKDGKVTLNDVKRPASGKIFYKPVRDTSYTLTVNKTIGEKPIEVKKELQVYLSPEITVKLNNREQQSIKMPPATETRLSWSAKNADYVRVNGKTYNKTKYWISLSPKKTKTYKIEAVREINGMEFKEELKRRISVSQQQTQTAVQDYQAYKTPNFSQSNTNLPDEGNWVDALWGIGLLVAVIVGIIFMVSSC